MPNIMTVERRKHLREFLFYFSNISKILSYRNVIKCISQIIKETLYLQCCYTAIITNMVTTAATTGGNGW